MARKPATRGEFTLFDVIYENGSQRSNRRVPSEILNSLDGDALARASIEEQDRLIAEKSGTPAIAVKSIHRSGSKRADGKRSGDRSRQTPHSPSSSPGLSGFPRASVRRAPPRRSR
jgi:hypothetical protein